MKALRLRVCLTCSRDIKEAHVLTAELGKQQDSEDMDFGFVDT